jgi:hypothetical protein
MGVLSMDLKGAAMAKNTTDFLISAIYYWLLRNYK